jgi:seryl-tRNA synthetase
MAINMSEVAKRISGTEFYKSLLQEESTKTIEERKSILASIKALKEENINAQKEIQLSISKKEDKLKLAQKKCEELKQEVNQLKHNSSICSVRFDTQKSSLEGSLRETADSRIDDALHLIKQKRQGLFALTPRTEVSSSKRNWVTLGHDKTFASNVPGIDAALKETLNATGMLRDMKLEPVLDEEKLKTIVNGVVAKSKKAGCA